MCLLGSVWAYRAECNDGSKVFAVLVGDIVFVVL